MKLAESFFTQKTEKIAESLLGKYLVHESPEGITTGKITETEAYLSDDPASHSFNGKTKRNSPMFGPPGTAYIYFTYGMYYCFNVVSNKRDVGEAVLIRSLEPVNGIELMKKRRKTTSTKNLCNGPAKLVMAMGITKEQNGTSLTESNLRIVNPGKKEKYKIIRTPRVGISKGMNLPLRFLIA